MNLRNIFTIGLLVTALPVINACSQNPSEERLPKEEIPVRSLENSKKEKEIPREVSQKSVSDIQKPTLKKAIEKNKSDIMVEPESFEHFFEYGFLPQIVEKDFTGLQEIMAPDLINSEDMSRIFNPQTLESFKKRTYKQSWNESEASYMIDLVEPNVGEYQFYFIFHASEKWHWRLEHVLAPG